MSVLTDYIARVVNSIHIAEVKIMLPADIHENQTLHTTLCNLVKYEHFLLEGSGDGDQLG
jgi:hypothetical protein